MKFSNRELYEWIDQEGGDHYWTGFGPVSPEEVEDENLRPLWTECIAAAMDFRDASDNVQSYLEGHLSDD